MLGNVEKYKKKFDNICRECPICLKCYRQKATPLSLLCWACWREYKRGDIDLIDFVNDLPDSEIIKY